MNQNQGHFALLTKSRFGLPPLEHFSPRPTVAPASQGAL